jgi:ankyrin repeat protein
MTLLHWACDRGYLDIVQLLVKRKAKLDIQDSEGNTPLHFASMTGHREIYCYLIEQGSDPHLRNKEGESAIENKHSN